ncbi:lytic transglycosylase domain-containing protein [Jannaschia sp. Os4]|uniref:lytic transglycosylase domain-containing protein n=1 Tax=Jannaschia sp. Os4 TaxID=2807617 RepID=UPI0019393D81|nr:lytic transglycosylase domain-containing protein [Jannaschia sp. Os4]MBM2574812.1 lytic transglycosylase domain-containing protein [Jannaschia sp. Os4]
MRLLLALLLLLAVPAAADPPPRLWCSAETGARHCIRADRFDADLCRQIEAEAAAHGIPADYFARLLWQESRFRPRAVSPAYAKGIAQFIDSTARLRGLKDQFNPAESVFRSAEYLGEMTRRYGNLGLAAAGYNGGERRVERFIARQGGFARETIDYVSIITGKTVQDWRDGDPKPDMRLSDGPFGSACLALAGQRRLRPLAPPAPPPVVFAPWGVQVGYGHTPQRARASYALLLPQCRQEARVEFVPQPARRGGGRAYIAVRLAAQTRREAARLCQGIRARGCGCAVYRNP